MTDLAGIWPDGIESWPEVWRAGMVFLGTFILEDVATIGAGFLASAGYLGWPVAFLTAFLGVWLGDLGLYALARGAGRRWFERRAWFQRHGVRIAESERWFARQGTSILILSRCVPGARLPTYLAAGFLRVPLARFLAVTGGASFIWTAAVLWSTHVLGGPILRWLGIFRQGALAVGIGTVMVLLLLRWAQGWVGQRVRSAGSPGPGSPRPRPRSTS